MIESDRGLLITIIHPSHSGFWLSQCSRSLQWRNGPTFSTFKNKGEQQHGEISFLTNLSQGSLNRLESLDEGYDSQGTFDPRFAVLLSNCLVGDSLICLKISLRILRMALCVRCACDQ